MTPFYTEERDLELREGTDALMRPSIGSASPLS